MDKIISTFLHAAVFSLLSLSAFSQSPVAGPTGSLEGIVIRSGTKEPVAGASVELLPYPYAPSSGPYLAESGSDGRFHFPDIPAGNYRLSASRAGFLRVEYGTHNPRGGLLMPMIVEPSRTTTNIQLSLVPAAVISGRAFDSHGNPLGGTLMDLYRPVYTDGRIVMSTTFFSQPMMTPVMTDDLGNFRFFSLAPGRYYVGFRYRASGAGPTSVYYPDTNDARNAQVIELTAGRIVDNINLTAPTDSPHHIRGRLNFDGDAVVRLASVNPSSISPPIAIDPVSGGFDIPSVTAGLYVLSASSAGLFGWTFVDVRNTDVENVSLTIRPGVDVPVHVLLDPAAIHAKDIDLLNMSFSFGPDPPIPGVSDSSFRPETNGNFTLHLNPGDYRIFARANIRNVYIQSIRLGTANVLDILNDGLHLDSGTVGTMEIVIGSNPGTLDGVVTDERQQADPAAVLIIAPEPPHRKRSDLYQYVYPDASGHFTFENIPPGNYTVFALEEIAPSPVNSEWQNPEFLRKYENTATSIHIDAGSKADVHVTAIRADPF